MKPEAEYGAESGNGQRGNFSWTELGKSMKMRGKLLCSGVGIKNSYKHRVQSADIDIIFGRMLKNKAVYNVNRGNAQAMAQPFRYWNISLGGDRQVLHIMICYNTIQYNKLYLESAC